MTAPGLNTRYRVPRDVLVETRELLLPSALEGLEGVVVWFARMRDGENADVLGAYRPKQMAYRSPLGLSVEIPQDAISAMIMTLPSGVFLAARVHTHGEEAYHSSMDDRNMLIAHAGAISIVVPHFVSEPIDLTRCSVNLLDAGGDWVELSVEEINTRFEVTNG